MFKLLSRKQTLSVTIILLLVTIPFWNSLTSTFGYFDDYSLKSRLASDNFSLIENEFFQDGRPLFGLAIAAMFGDEAEVEQLSIVRGIGVIGIITLALIIYFHARKHRLSESTSIGWALLFALHPACAIAGFWATAVPLLWATVFGGASALCYLAGSRERLHWYLFSLLFALASILTYQTGITIAAAIILVPLFCAHQDSFREHARTAIIGISALCSLLFIYYCSFHLLLHLEFIGQGRGGREALLSSLPRTVPRLFSLFLPAASGSWSYFLPHAIRSTIIACIGLSIAGGWFFYFKKHGKAAFLTFILWLITLAILITPLLPLASFWAHFRVLPALAFALWLPLLSLIHQGTERRPKLTDSALLCLGILTTALATFAISFVRVPQLVQEWQLLENELNQKAPELQPLLTMAIPDVPFRQKKYWHPVGEYEIRSTGPSWILRGRLIK